MNLDKYFRGDGRARVSIGQDAPETERFAASELTKYLKRMTGRSVQLVEGRPVGNKKTCSFLVGSAAGSSRPKLGYNTVAIRRASENEVIIAGGSNSATLHAVYELLDILGCRWFHPAVEYVPELETVDIPDNYEYTPSFIYRDLLWENALNGDWACRNRLNGMFAELKERHGEKRKWETLSHSFYKIVPPEKYGKEHPEYFSYREGQGHLLSGAQLCLSNPEVLSMAVDYAMEMMSRPETWIVGVNQMDCANPCACAGCRAADERAGSYSGALLEFLNKIAEQTSIRYPDKYVSTLAYQHTQAPPRGLVAHPNVIVKLCHMEPSCDAHPLHDCEHNSFYVECLEGWTKICANVFVWHYSTNFLHNLGFHPNFHALAKDTRFYHEAGVKGIFFQGQRRHGIAFAELESYVQARLAWNVDRDFFKEANAFMNAFYGPAAPAIKKFTEIMHENVMNGTHSHLYTHPAEGTFTRDQLERMRKSLGEGIEAAEGDQAVLHRLDYLKMWHNYTSLAAIPPLVDEAGNFRVLSAPKAELMFDETKKLMAKSGVEHIREFPADDQDFDKNPGWCVKERELRKVASENGLLKIEIVPELGGMLCSMIEQERGIDICCKPAPWMLGYPFIGGYTEGVKSGMLKTGFHESFEADKEDTSIVMHARLSGDIITERSFSLLPDSAAVRIRSVYMNNGVLERELKSNYFLILQIGNYNDITFFRLDKNDRFEFTNPVFPEGGFTSAAQWLVYSGEKCPNGVWGCFDNKRGIGLMDDWRGIDVASCWSNVYLRDQRILLEVTGAPQIVPPGEHVEFEHVYTLINKLPER